MSSLWEWTAWEIRQALDARRVSAVEVATAFLERIQAMDEAVHGYLQVADDVLAQAARADERLAARDRGWLIGVPIAVKDIISVKGLRNTCGSRILESYAPPYDATAIERLRAAGAVILGKTNLDEFAMGSSTENSAFGPTRNPWDLTRVPGGSSGGSAAVVAAGEAPVALGTDTGGSVRQPAAFCGVTGLKPTYGRVSRYGLVAYASSLDQIGVLGRDARDCAMLLGAMAGSDPRDSTSAPVPVDDYVAGIETGAEGMRIGVPREFMDTDLAPEIRQHVERAAARLERCGASLREVRLPRVKYALPAYYVIAPAEASSNLARFDGVRYGHRASGGADVVSMMKASREAGFGDEVKRRIMIGTYALSAGYYDAYYLKAQKVRTLIREDFENAFQHCDVILGPATPSVAFKIGEKSDPLDMYLSDIYTVAVNLAGLPGVVVPCGFESDLPVGLQMIGPAFHESRLLAAAHAFQKATDYHRKRPALELSTWT